VDFGDLHCATMLMIGMMMPAVSQVGALAAGGVRERLNGKHGLRALDRHSHAVRPLRLTVDPLHVVLTHAIID